MKKALYFLTGILLLASCQQEEIPSGEGFLSLTGIEVQTQEITNVASRAVDEDLTVDLYKGEQKVHTLTAEEMQSKIELEPATDYKLKVYSANYGQDNNWTNKMSGEPVYYKEEPFEVKEGETTALKVQVPMCNYAVSLVLPEGVEKWMTYTFEVTSGDRTVILQDGGTAYFPVSALGSPFSYKLKLTNTDSESFELTGTWGDTEGETVEMNTVYVITYSMEYNALKVSL
ncbi:DUF4493 domain-containing protein [Phocaeicola coprophilus]|uniref:DUF4493 domain-containing protein n=1 Tax=Phocaeicola coprophilus TaxID=387090 RepID=UPI00266B61FC|nr:DUF4493 domain-containing protein [Phocaeicola coprophilus]